MFLDIQPRTNQDNYLIVCSCLCSYNVVTHKTINPVYQYIKLGKLRLILETYHDSVGKLCNEG